MFFKKLEVKNYRNADARTVEFAEERNAFVGENARGKTNLLEALYFSGVGKSFRTPREKELIKSGCDTAYFAVTAVCEDGERTVKTVLDRAANKRVAINGIPISRMSELMGVCPVVLFCPDGLKIVKEAPADRRRFMDIALCQVSKAYFAALSRYNRILQNRNRLLKNGASEKTIAPWNELLADEGARIVKSRKGYIKNLVGYAADRHSYLTDGRETLFIEYEGEEGESLEEIKRELYTALERDFEADTRLKYTHSGPHRDDIKISVNGSDVRTYGSQGQQRTAALSLKLAEMRLLSDVLGTSPALLLDDVFSELDISRRKKLLAALDGFQTVITCTDEQEFSEFGVNVIHI